VGREKAVSNITCCATQSTRATAAPEARFIAWRLNAGFDFVILLHGDGQYAPELLPSFVETWRTHDAHVVLVPGMHSPSGKPAGAACRGTSWLVIVGTMFQTRLTGGRLSEYHTGYRGYSTRFLGAVRSRPTPTASTSDTETCCRRSTSAPESWQLPIPTHYGDEVCRVPGLRYAGTCGVHPAIQVSPAGRSAA